MKTPSMAVCSLQAYVLVDFGMGRPPIIPIVTTVHSVVTLVVRIALYISLVAVYKHYGLGVGSTRKLDMKFLGL